ALREKQKPVSYLLADDEGHGFAKPVNRMAMYAETERFLAEHLGGRYQEDMPEEASKRLNELKVDINSVTYKPKEAVASIEALPEIDNLLKETSVEYDVQLEVQGQKIPMTMTRKVSRKGDNWIITDAAVSQMGNATDEIELTSEFIPVSRNIDQMGQKITMQYTPDKVTVDAMGQNMEMTFDGAMVSDGPGMDMIIAGLPLKEGYQLTFDMPNMTTMKPKQVYLTVEGKETVNGIETWIVNLVAADNENDKTTLWINPEAKLAEKMVQVIPAMGNAVMTTTKK
ncbi:MAG: alpha/beta hydrolase family protein, partial [Cyclobacteriaceae bacterium]